MSGENIERGDLLRRGFRQDRARLFKRWLRIAAGKRGLCEDETGHGQKIFHWEILSINNSESKLLHH